MQQISCKLKAHLAPSLKSLKILSDSFPTKLLLRIRSSFSVDAKALCLHFAMAKRKSQSKVFMLMAGGFFFTHFLLNGHLWITLYLPRIFMNLAQSAHSRSLILETTTKKWLKPCDGLLLRFSSWKPQFPLDRDTTTICATNWLLNCFAVGLSLKTMHALLPVLWGRLFLNKQRRINKIENPQELKKTKKGVNNLRGVFLLNLFWAGP